MACLFVRAAAAVYKKKMSAPSEDTTQGVRDDIVDEKGPKSSWCGGILVQPETEQCSGKDGEHH